MHIRHFFRVFLFSFAVFTLPLLGGGGLLKLDDVHGIMQQIVSQHVEGHDVTPIVLQRSLKLYINEMDPLRVYFTEEELQPYLNPSKRELEKYVAAYRKGDFTVFSKLNQLGQMAIKRFRDQRSKLEKNWDSLLADALKPGASNKGLPSDPFAQIPFATSDAELRELQRDSLVRFIATQLQRFSLKAVENKSERVIAMFERQIRLDESEFLFEDNKGEPLSAQAQEHYFTLHILKSLASSLDSHTAFFNNVEAYDMRVRLEKGFQGIGVVLQEGIDGVVVAKLVDGSPAAKSGLIQVNDQLVEIDGKSVVDEPFASVLEWIRGDEGTLVVLGIKRTALLNGEEQEQFLKVQLRREKIIMNEDRVDVSSEKYGEGIIGKIKLYSFYDNGDGISSENDIKAAIKKLNEIGKLKGLVLDLRENTGGFLIQAVKVAGLFINNGVIVTAKYSNGQEKIFRDLNGRTFYNGPLIILTSRMTASAAEIVAETLQDYGVALIVGDERTYGKGSIQHQTVTTKDSSSFFKVTVGKYYTVSGKTPQVNGVKADIVVPTILSYERIGEQYLDYPLNNDTIPDSFNDDLRDIAKEARPWYARYYLPSLEKKSERWTKLKPILKTNSAKRLSESGEFQAFLKRGSTDLAEQLKKLQEQKDQKETDRKDFQMTEAVNIMKDMITLKPVIDNR